MRKRGTVNRKDTAKMRGRKTIRRVRRNATYLVMHNGRMLRGRLVMRGRGTLPSVVRII